ncbi:MAG: phosphatidylserine decarboxylase family protein [Alphaproteobacteria bacterium]|uniref:Phosphatidylserine decarboxylase proenzyme n=1 Tax=Candidatus Nitrobium versatile TaxID=2884831 RepID=A0A953M2G4_9BACT|nr:phosphatidylserine decarboxylase family protein [Candidatus Nitrobium versatile]
MKFAPEGYPFFAFFGGITVLSFLAGGPWIALVPFLLTLFMGYFFRDPERSIPGGEEAFVSPADGRIIQIRPVEEAQYLKGRAVEISIFMSPLNVHVNRAPCDGVVEAVVHSPGKFLSAFKPEASLCNENIVMLLKGKECRVLVRQVAGAIARRAVCRVRAGHSLKKGERYGIIKFSSRLDVFLPENTVITVQVGDKVRAGETILGHLKKGENSGSA